MRLLILCLIIFLSSAHARFAGDLTVAVNGRVSDVSPRFVEIKTSNGTLRVDRQYLDPTGTLRPGSPVQTNLLLRYTEVRSGRRWLPAGSLVPGLAGCSGRC
jgi:hypothetical protein